MFEDSDNDYSSEEDAVISKQLRKGRERDDSESEVEVLGVGSDQDSEEQSDIALSDVEGQQDDDDLPDARAWGKQKRIFYGADYVDPDYGGFEGKDAHAAEVEQEEVQELQNQLMTQLDVNFLKLGDIFKKAGAAADEQDDEMLKTDLSDLSTKQKLQKLKKESPEFFVILEDFKVQMNLAKDYLHPVLQKVQKGAIQRCKAADFVQTHYRIILNYATNIYMYLLLRSSNQLKNHPIAHRLYQYRQLLSQIEPVFEEIVKPQISLLMDQEALEDGIKQKEDAVKSKKRKTLKLLTQLQAEKSSQLKRKADESHEPSKKIKNVTFDESESDEENVDHSLEPAEDNEEPSKRAITYQIAKNKGLTPYRKKELRNPRVKHKLKFRKALIRRKGAVREPRRELTRYSGEISGIKASVSKSIKIKS